MIERSLVLLKPDCVYRGLIGRVIQRFEDSGYKIVGMKMVWADEKITKEHYADVTKRKGEIVTQKLVDMFKSGPLVAMVLEGLHAVEVIRKLVGETQGKAAIPGTIRGDFSTQSYAYSDAKGFAIKNLVHASATLAEAAVEIKLWFKDSELVKSYKSVHDYHL